MEVSPRLAIAVAVRSVFALDKESRFAWGKVLDVLERRLDVKIDVVSPPMCLIGFDGSPFEVEIFKQTNALQTFYLRASNSDCMLEFAIKPRAAASSEQFEATVNSFRLSLGVLASEPTALRMDVNSRPFAELSVKAMLQNCREKEVQRYRKHVDPIMSSVDQLAVFGA